MPPHGSRDIPPGVLAGWGGEGGAVPRLQVAQGATSWLWVGGGAAQSFIAVLSLVTSQVPGPGCKEDSGLALPGHIVRRNSGFPQSAFLCQEWGDV